MRLISWNINSLNAALTNDSACAKFARGILNTIKEKGLGITVIQETKLQSAGPTKEHQKILAEMFPDYGYVWRSSEEPVWEGCAGTMFLYKNTPAPEVAKPVIGAPEPMNHEGRILILKLDNYYITQVYTPNSGSELEQLDDRQVWDEKHTKYLQKLDQDKPVIVSGDYNVARTPVDLRHPESNHHNASFTDEERQDFDKLLKLGFTDTLREVHGNVEGVYSWQAQRVGTGEASNSGWRVDYCIVSNKIADQITKSKILDTGERKDHCSVMLEISL